MTDANDDALISAKNEFEGAYDKEMVQILQEMVESDQDITARGVIRRHSALKAASSITRNKARSTLLACQTACNTFQIRGGNSVQ